MRRVSQTILSSSPLARNTLLTLGTRSINAVPHRSYIYNRLSIEQTNFETPQASGLARDLLDGYLFEPRHKPKNQYCSMLNSLSKRGLASDNTTNSDGNDTSGDKVKSKQYKRPSTTGEKTTELLKLKANTVKLYNTRSKSGSSGIALEGSTSHSSETKGGATAEQTKPATSLVNVEDGSRLNVRIEHDKKRKRFTLDLGDDQEAWIDYRAVQNKGGSGESCFVELYHTEVPKELRGKGIGRVLAEGALDSIVELEKWRIQITCSYLENYMEKYAKEEHRRLII